MIIKFKEGSSANVDMFRFISPRLGILIYSFISELEALGIEEIIITSLIRPKDTDSGVHALGRGCDISASFPAALGVVAMDTINKKYPYDMSRPELKSVIFHEGSGYKSDQALHYHLQTKD